VSELDPEIVVEEVETPHPHEEDMPDIESSAWRLGPGGLLISSVVERHAAWLAEQEKETIFFYADLGESGLVKNDEETSQKVFRSLASVGLTEGQIINAVNRMQQDGILFREAAV
jgi:hypothetical protein